MKENKSYILLNIIGKNIKSLRLSKGLNQIQLAAKLNLSRTSLVNIEKGSQTPSLILLYSFAQALEVTIFDLIPDIIPDNVNDTTPQKEKESKSGPFNLEKNLDAKVQEFILSFQRKS